MRKISFQELKDINGGQDIERKIADFLFPRLKSIGESLRYVEKKIEEDFVSVRKRIARLFDPDKKDD